VDLGYSLSGDPNAYVAVAAHADKPIQRVGHLPFIAENRNFVYGEYLVAFFPYVFTNFVKNGESLKPRGLYDFLNVGF
jgi:hypothetical protein